MIDSSESTAAFSLGLAEWIFVELSEQHRAVTVAAGRVEQLVVGSDPVVFFAEFFEPSLVGPCGMILAELGQQRLVERDGCWLVECVASAELFEPFPVEPYGLILAERGGQRLLERGGCWLVAFVVSAERDEFVRIEKIGDFAL